MMARKIPYVSAHHFDFKRWLFWGEHNTKTHNNNSNYPEGYPSPQDCLPDPENDIKDVGANEYGC